jgi:hypothetical protein
MKTNKYTKEFIHRMLREYPVKRFQNALYYKILEYEKEGFFVNSDEIVEVIKLMQEMYDDETPNFYVLSKSGKFANLFNEVGVLLKVVTTDELKQYKGLKQLTHAQVRCVPKTNILEDLLDIKEHLILKLCYKNNFKVFGNGNLYAKTKQILREKGIHC